MSPLEGAQPEPEVLFQRSHHWQPDLTLPDLTLKEYERLVVSWLRPSRQRPDFPSRRRLKRLAALHYICPTFEVGVYYTESAFNDPIRDRNPFDTDDVQLRRMMVDYAMMDRAANGTRDLRVDGYLALFSWDPGIPGTRPFHRDGETP